MFEPDPDTLEELRRALGKKDVTITVGTTAVDAYVFTSIVGLASRYPGLSDDVRDMGFNVALRIQKFVCDTSGMPPSHQLAEHVDSEAECTALMKKHFDDAQNIQFKLSPGEAFNVVGLMQVAIRHPESPGTIMEIATMFGKTIQKLLSQAVQSQAVFDILEMGWSEELDV